MLREVFPVVPLTKPDSDLREPHPPDLDLDLSLTKTLGSISTELGLVDNKTIISSAVNIFHLKSVYFVFLLY